MQENKFILLEFGSILRYGERHFFSQHTMDAFFISYDEYIRQKMKLDIKKRKYHREYWEQFK